jgi:hypothetical protein
LFVFMIALLCLVAICCILYAVGYYVWVFSCLTVWFVFVCVTALVGLQALAALAALRPWLPAAGCCPVLAALTAGWLHAASCKPS